MANEKILVVDDDVNICELLRLYLEKEGYTVSIVNDGESAVKSFGEIQPDLMLLDIMLPRLDGWQVCREIRKFSDKPIIMLTAKGETFDKVLGLELGADDYVVKPFDAKEVVARVKAVLRRSAGAPAADIKQVEYDKLKINLTNYELWVDGKRIDTPPKSWSLSITLPATRTGCSPVTSCSTKSGASTITAIRERSMSMSRGSERSSRACPTSGSSRPSGA